MYFQIHLCMSCISGYIKMTLVPQGTVLPNIGLHNTKYWFPGLVWDDPHVVWEVGGVDESDVVGQDPPGQYDPEHDRQIALSNTRGHLITSMSGLLEDFGFTSLLTTLVPLGSFPSSTSALTSFRSCISHALLSILYFLYLKFIWNKEGELCALDMNYDEWKELCKTTCVKIWLITNW